MFLIGAILGFVILVLLFPKIVKAGAPDWVDTSICTATQCGTSEGTKTQSKTTPGYNTPVVCDHACPSVEFSTSRQVIDVPAHKEHRHCMWEAWGNCITWGDWYDGNGHGSGLKETRDVPATHKTETFGPITVQYGEKSSDENHCHRPTGSSLNVPSWAMSDFNALNTELSTEEKNCTGGDWVPESVETRTVSCNDATVTTCPSVCGNYEKEEGEECDDGNVQDGDGCSSVCKTEIKESCPDSWIGDQNCDEVCNVEEHRFDGGDCDITSPTPTPIQQSEPTCEEQMRNGTWHGEHECGWSPKPWAPGPYAPATCGGIYPSKPLLQHFVRINSTTVELGWWGVTNANKYSLIYGYYGESMIHGIADINRNVTRIQIGALRSNTAIQAQLWAWNGECVTKSDIVDP